MKNAKWMRIPVLCLAIVCLLGAVAAATYDLNDDGKTDVWDLQMAKNNGLSQEELAEAVKMALGNRGDELHLNAEGQYEIWSMLGFQNLLNNAKNGASFKLMADIDLQGIDWVPLDFNGTFDGNGHTISNVKITEDNYNGKRYAMGFFSTIGSYTKDGELQQSVVENLHLENIDLTATKDSQYMGLLAGTNKGIVRNCTATGSVTDSRTQLPKEVRVGALVGCNENTDPSGILEKGTDLLTATAGTSNPEDKVEGISAKMATFFATLSYPEDATEKPERFVGIVGYSRDANVDKTMLWQDTSGSVMYKDEAEQERRQTAVDKMYTMGTVRWTASETVASLKESGGPTHAHSNLFVEGYTYIGLPYVASYNGSYERFLSQMQDQKDAEGRYVTVTGLEDGVKYAAGNATGVCRYLGNNCSMAIGWAWATVSPSHVSATQNGAVGNSSYAMVPNEYNTKHYGVLAVGGYAQLPVAAGKYADAADAQDTIELIDLNGGAKGMAEYYALASKGDALVYVDKLYNAETDSYSNVNAHARMLSADPVIIRNYKSGIDLEKSYVITHEQGDGLYDNKMANGKNPTIKDIHNHPAGVSCEDCQKYGQYTVKATSWRIDYKYSLSTLLSQKGYDDAVAAGQVPGSGFGYVPVTIPAYSAETLNDPYYNEYNSASNYHPVTWPDSGWFYSNYLVTSVTMVIEDAQGNEVYNKTEYPTQDGKISGYATIKLEREFPDAGKSLVAGQTYYVTLTATDSTGSVNIIRERAEFTYSPQ